MMILLKCKEVIIVTGLASIYSLSAYASCQITTYIQIENSYYNDVEYYADSKNNLNFVHPKMKVAQRSKSDLFPIQFTDNGTEGDAKFTFTPINKNKAFSKLNIACKSMNPKICQLRCQATLEKLPIGQYTLSDPEGTGSASSPYKVTVVKRFN